MRRLLLALGILLACSTSAFAQFVNGGTVVASCASASSAFTTTTGNTIVVAARYSATGTISGITDDGGDTFTLVTSETNVSNISNLEIWIAKNITGHTNNTVTVTWPASPTACYLAAGQWQGVTTTPTDANAKGQATGAGTTSVTSSAYTTTQAAEYIIAGITNNVGSSVPSATGYTVEVQDAQDVVALLDTSVSSIQTGVTTTITTSPAASALALGIVTLKQTGGGTTPGCKNGLLMNGVGCLAR